MIAYHYHLQRRARRRHQRPGRRAKEARRALQRHHDQRPPRIGKDRSARL